MLIMRLLAHEKIKHISCIEVASYAGKNIFEPHLFTTNPLEFRYTTSDLKFKINSASGIIKITLLYLVRSTKLESIL